MKPLEFSGGTGGSLKVANTIIGSDNVEVLVGISQGPINGLKNGGKTFQLDDTPLVNTDGTQNFKNISLDVYPGLATGHTITPALGGFASPTPVGQLLATSTPVVRNGSQTYVDAVDYRIVVNTLYKQTSKGSFTNDLTLLFEWKRLSDVGWTPAWVTGSSAYGTDTTLNFTPNGTALSTLIGDVLSKQYQATLPQVQSFNGDQQFLTTTTGAPVVPPDDQTRTATAVDSTGAVWLWDTTGLVWVSRTLTNAVMPLTGFKTYITLDGITTRRRYLGGSAPLNAQVGDVWHKDNTTLLTWNGAAWVIGLSPILGTVNVPSHALANGVWKLTEKVTSPLPLNVRIFIPPLLEKIQLRVTNQTPANTTELFSSVTWESIQEIKRTPLTFFSCAMAHLVGQASDQFTSLPVWNGIYQGRIIKVPSNYNSATRVYTGMWDGTYILAYTNNTAMVFQDFVENDQYGLSSIYPHTVNKWKIYEWAQYCDEQVARYDTTLRPRFTFNDYVDTPRPASEMAKYIAGSAAAIYVDDGNGVVDIMINKDYEPVAIFTRENVTEAGFEYTYSDRQARPNFITVSFINPSLNWNEDKRLVTNDTDIATYGKIPLEFIATGCTDADEAIASARRRLITGLTEKEFVTFSTNRKGRYLTEWDTILVADADMGTGISGRLTAVTGARSMTIRDPITIAGGFTYVATFDIPNSAYPATSTSVFTTVRRTVTNTAGVATSLTFSADLPTLPEYAAFTLEAVGLLGTPKPYRIMKINRETGDPDRIQIVALEVNRNKYSYIDTAIDQGVITYSSLTNSMVLPPASLSVDASLHARGAATVRSLTLKWPKSPSEWIRDYTITHWVGGVPSGSTTTKGLSATYENAPVDVHRWEVVATDIKGKSSNPIAFAYDVAGDTRTIPAVANLRMLDQPGALTSATISPKFTWDTPAIPDPNFAFYQVQTFNNGTNALLRTESTGTLAVWTYDWEKQVIDWGTPNRVFRIEVTAWDQFGASSDVTSLVITNATPATPGTAVLTGAIGGFNVNVPVTTERDAEGLLLWVSTTNGFDPLAVSPVQDAGPGNSFFVQAAVGVTNYVRTAYYDRYSKAAANLNISAQQSVSVLAIGTGGTSILGTNVFRADGTTSVTDATAITTLGTAAAIAGQGSLATLSTIGSSQITDGSVASVDLSSTAARLGTNIVKNDGSTSLTDALAVTSLGIAASISGQGALATLGTINSSALVSSGVIIYTALSSTAARLGTNVTKNDGTTSLTDALAVTSLGVAASIASQGSLATLSALNASSQIGSNLILASKLALTDGSNMVRDATFADANAWAAFGSTVTLDTSADTITTMGVPQSVKIVATAANPQATSGYAQAATAYEQVQAGKSYTFYANLLHKVAFKGQTYIQVTWYKQDGTTSISTATAQSGADYRTTPRATTDENTTIFGSLVAPALAVFAKVLIGITWPAAAASAGTALIGNPSMFRTVDNNLLTSTAVRLGTNITKNDGTTSLTDALAVTSLGTAAGFTGQGALASLNTINSSALMGAGTVISTVLSSTAARLGTNITKNDGSTSLTDALAVTSLGTAAAFTGQGALASLATINSSALLDAGTVIYTTLSTTAVRLGTNITKNDGTTSLTDALAVTSLGTAAGFTGQGALASLNTINSSALMGAGTVISTVLSSTAARLGTNITKNDGSTSLTDALAVTSLGTASAISGQGSLATLSTVGSAEITNNSVAYGDLTATAARIGGNLTKADGTTATSDAILVTSLGTASAFTGQGALATLATINSSALLDAGTVIYTTLSTTAVRLGTNITKNDGTTSLTDALAVTSLGTASAISGQAAAATDSTIAVGATKNTVSYAASAPTSPTNGDLWADTSTTPIVWKLRVSGAWQDGSSLGGVFGTTLLETIGGIAATLANFKTALGTASAISGQASAATDATIATGATRNQTFYQTADPTISNTVVDNAWWFNPTTSVLYQRASSAWVAIAGQILDGVTMFSSTTSSASSTFTVPANAPGFVTVTITGGRGGAGNTGGTGPWLGGSGSQSVKHFAVSPGDTIVWANGLNGANSVSSNGGNGGTATATCSHGSISLSAPGGIGGSTTAIGAGGTGASGGDTNTNGTAGGSGSTSITIVAHTS
jgi:predicted phage tail protein